MVKRKMVEQESEGAVKKTCKARVKHQNSVSETQSETKEPQAAEVQGADVTGKTILHLSNEKADKAQAVEEVRQPSKVLHPIFNIVKE